MYRYFAYGLGIHSELDFPELLTVDGPADVTIRLAETRLSHEHAQDGIWHISPMRAEVWYSTLGSCIVRDGKEIILDPAGGDETSLRLLVLGPVLAMLLHQRGRLVLHASAVEIDGKGVAFVGPSDCGKSTTAMAFHTRGHVLIADDLVSISFDGENHAIIDPAPPFVKIWPDAATALGENIATAPRVSPTIDKRVKTAADRCSRAAVRLQRICVLEESDCEEIVPLSPQEAFVELVRHTFVVRVLRKTDTAAAHFRQSSRLANTVAVRRLKRRKSLDSLPRIVDLLERELETNSPLELD